MAAFFNAIRPHLELNEDENDPMGFPWPESVVWNWECRSNSQNSTVGMFLMQRWSLLKHHRLASIENNMSHYWANTQEIESGKIHAVDSFYGSGFWADGGQIGDLPVHIAGVQPGGTERYGKWLFFLASE
jgi:hypothetical protein